MNFEDLANNNILKTLIKTKGLNKNFKPEM